MLVITRSVGKDETVILQTSDGTVEFSIEAISGGQVRVGINAPKNVRIFRNELLERIEATEVRSHVQPEFKSLSHLEA